MIIVWKQNAQYMDNDYILLSIYDSVIASYTNDNAQRASNKVDKAASVHVNCFLPNLVIVSTELLFDREKFWQVFL